MRGFLAFAAAERGGEPSLPRLKGPKRPRSVPRPVSPDDAVALAEEVGEDATAAVDRGARPGGAAAALRLGPARRRGARPHRRGACRWARRSASPASAARPGSCRCSRRCATRSSLSVALPLSDRAGTQPLFRGARGGPLNGEMIRRAVRKARGPARPVRPDHAARPAPQLRHPSARPRRRPALAPGAARPCQPVLDPDLHRGRRRPSARRLPQRPSAGVKRNAFMPGVRSVGGIKRDQHGPEPQLR